MIRNSWNYPARQRPLRPSWAFDRWAGTEWVECEEIDRNGSLIFVEDVDTKERMWVGVEELRK